jgi:hypothetical protein
MKNILYLFLIAGFFFWHPRHSFALEDNEKLISACASLQISPDYSTVSNNRQASTAFSYDDLLTDDDDDVTVSARKKVSFVNYLYIVLAGHRLQSTPPGSAKLIFTTPYFTHLPPSPFAALKVFRL